MTAALTRLRALAAFEAETKAVVVGIQQDWQNIDSAVRTLSAEAAPNVNQRVANWLVGKGKAIIRDAACELGWQQLTQDEQSTVHGLVDNQNWKPTNSDQLSGLGDMTLEAATGAIGDTARNEFLKLFYPASAVDWFFYAKGLYEKADALTSGNRTISHPDGSITRAYIYYVRACLAPPK